MNKKGLFYKSPNNVCTNYFIEYNEGRFDGEICVGIYEILDFEDYGYKNGDEIVVLNSDLDLLVCMDLVGKYFTLNFKENIQFYYDEEKYFSKNYKTDSVASLSDVINFAIEKSCINKY